MIKSHTLTSALVLLSCLSTASESVSPRILGSNLLSYGLSTTGSFLGSKLTFAGVFSCTSIPSLPFTSPWFSPTFSFPLLLSSFGLKTRPLRVKLWIPSFPFSFSHKVGESCSTSATSTFFSLLSPSQNSVACREDSGTSLSQNSRRALKLKLASPEVKSTSSSLSLPQNSITKTSLTSSFIALLLTAHASSFSISFRISSSDLYSPITYTPPEEKLGSGFFLVLGCPCSGSGILPCSIKS